ncbi:MAG: T9SS type A sorting domain-containing protein, partial [Candidatus Poribacteria bacterium]|nr:T9SS type A sorting domain-containing protein [Candidatus Poribacteria bacterium]
NLLLTLRNCGLNTRRHFTSSDTVTINIDAGVAEDTNGNPTPAATLTVSGIDYTSPELLEVRTPTEKQPASFDITLVFSEDISSFFLSHLWRGPHLHNRDAPSPSSITINGTNVILTFSPPGDLETWSSRGSISISYIDGSYVRDLADNFSYYYSDGGWARPMPTHTPVRYFRLSDYDLDQDDDVDTADVKIAVQALGQSGNSITDERVDVDDDGDVDKDDVLLVLANLDEGAVAPLNTDLFTDIPEEFLDGLDLSMIASTLDALVIENDDSLKYQRAITFFQALLIHMRPEETLLLANYPNPFNPETWIPYELANPSNVTIIIYNMQGIVVRRLDLGHQQEGYYTGRGSAAYWDGKNDMGEHVASGIYFYQLQADNMSFLRKMVILK